MDAREFHRIMEEEKNQCRFYPGCTNTKTTATLTEGKDKFKLCVSCMQRYIKDNPKVELEINRIKL